MLPQVGSDTLKTIAYGAEVGGRALGVASIKILVPGAERRAAIEKSGNAIVAAVKNAAQTHIARLLVEFIDHRVAVGKGRGIDRGFDATVSASSEAIRTSLPDRSTRNPDYLAIFPNGAEEYTSPTVKEDETLAEELRNAVEQSKLTAKSGVLELLDAIVPIVGPAAKDVRDGEGKVNELFQTELVARKNVIDTLWQERKNIESALGRSGRGLARFIFFDFRKGSSPDEDEPQGAPTAPDAPAGSEPT